MLCNTFEMYIPPPPTHLQTHTLVCISYTIYIVSLAAGHSNEMATNGDISMISPPTSSISNDQDPFGQLPPLPPPLRSTQVLQPLSVFPGAETIKLHLYSCNCSPVYSLLCLPYLFSSIYCSIERSSNFTIVTSFVFVLLSPSFLSLPTLPVYFHHDFIATLYRCVAR